MAVYFSIPSTLSKNKILALRYSFKTSPPQAQPFYTYASCQGSRSQLSLSAQCRKVLKSLTVTQFHNDNPDDKVTNASLPIESRYEQPTQFFSVPQENGWAIRKKDEVIQQQSKSKRIKHIYIGLPMQEFCFLIVCCLQICCYERSCLFFGSEHL